MQLHILIEDHEYRLHAETTAPETALRLLKLAQDHLEESTYPPVPVEITEAAAAFKDSDGKQDAPIAPAPEPKKASKAKKAAEKPQDAPAPAEAPAAPPAAVEPAQAAPANGKQDLSDEEIAKVLRPLTVEAMARNKPALGELLKTYGVERLRDMPNDPATLRDFYHKVVCIR